jgi:F-type H+-transporting ATPase subunit alpha
MNNLLTRQHEWLARYQAGLRIREVGSVLSIGDGITWISGLPSAAMDDVILLADGSRALVFDLSPEHIGAVLLEQSEQLSAGTAAYLTHQPLRIPAGRECLGRVLDPLGKPLDGRELSEEISTQPLYAPSPPIIARDYVHQPLYTGSKIIDTLIPIGRGQRQLIIGDEGLGRSALALDSIINQRDQNVICIYVLIGQKRTTVVNTIDLLEKFGALDYTTVVVAEANALPGLVHLAPFAGCAIAEYWMAQGRHTLVIYDDLSTHANTYRELSLLLRRPPGREAYPGDIFSVHAQLLERSTCLHPSRGGGSMTALPIVETKQGEIAAYIPTNLISITDGQIYLDQELFSGGFRPAIDIGRSVSRIGGAAQHPRIKAEAGRMKLDYLQFLELEVFTRFGARIEASMEAAIARGRVLREILKQDRLTPFAISYQLAWMIAFNEHLFDSLNPEQVKTTLQSLAQWLSRTTLTLDSARTEWLSGLTLWQKDLSGAKP